MDLLIDAEWCEDGEFAIVHRDNTVVYRGSGYIAMDATSDGSSSSNMESIKLVGVYGSFSVLVNRWSQDGAAVFDATMSVTLEMLHLLRSWLKAVAW